MFFSLTLHPYASNEGSGDFAHFLADAISTYFVSNQPLVINSKPHVFPLIRKYYM